MALLRSIQAFLGIGEEGEGHPPSEAEGEGEANGDAEPRPRKLTKDAALFGIFEGILHKLELIDHRFEALARVEAAVGGMSGMVQFLAKGGEKRDRDLRAHITTELDKLGATLRLDAGKQAALDVFKTVLPGLDNLDFVLQQSGTEEHKSLAMIQKKLLESFAKLGIEEIVVEEGKTHFDGELHDGEPWQGDPERTKGLEKGTIVHVERVGYRTSDVLIRAAKVLVAS